MIRTIYKISLYVFTLLMCYICSCLFRFRLYLNGVRFGKNVWTYNAVPKLVINRKAGNVCIGNNVKFNNYNDAGWNSKCSIWVRERASLSIGDNSGFNGVFLYAADNIVIGKNVKVGGGTRIFDTDFHPLNYIVRRDSNEGTKTKPVIIHDDVFIGTNSIIGKGVEIGERSIIAAGSVVVKSVPAGEVWGGNPAKFIKSLQLC